jgi:magnesium-transporting ATPase (P-type)
VIAVMLASGQLLEARASARARRELSLLVERAPRTARRRVEGGVAEVAVDDVVPGDRLLVGAGEIVPVDGRLLSPAVLDESALTGESRPAERIAGEDVRSGVVNAGQPIELVATAAAAESTYSELEGERRGHRRRRQRIGQAPEADPRSQRDGELGGTQREERHALPRARPGVHSLRSFRSGHYAHASTLCRVAPARQGAK